MPWAAMLALRVIACDPYAPWAECACEGCCVVVAGGPVAFRFLELFDVTGVVENEEVPGIW